MNRLDGKIALVTGGASGIGLATVKRFAAVGAKVVIGDVRPPSERLDGDVVYESLDVRDAARVEKVVGDSVTRWGRLDVVFNNAGIEFHGPLAATDPAEHRRMVDINLNGAYYVLQSAVKAMLANDGPSRGAIVNTASVAGLTGCPGMSTYNATKAAVVMLTKNASLEYGSFGIRVNAICPGIIRTPMALAAVGNDSAYLDEIGRKAHPLGRVGEADEVAKLVTFLASDDASFISGAAIPIDGAMTAGFMTAPGWEPTPS
jgi:meso-butanediol dehydrogenase/(S,S)-butanediol dehydrogenase/diacetyl reductase